MYGHTQVIRQWAAPLRIKISNLTVGQTLAITINLTKIDAVEYDTSDTLETLATKLQSVISDNFAGWAVTAINDEYVIIQQNYYTPNVTNFEISDETVNVTILNGNYQTSLTGFNQSQTNVTRNDGVSTAFGGCNYKSFLEYYGGSGGENINQNVGTSTIIRRSRFNEEDNPLLVEHYGTYETYIEDKMCRYPYGRNVVVLNDGKGDTERLADVMYMDNDGIYKPGYPAAYYCHTYSVPGTPFTEGEWYLESAQECLFIRRNILQATSGITNETTDDLNKGLIEVGASVIGATMNY